MMSESLLNSTPLALMEPVPKLFGKLGVKLVPEFSFFNVNSQDS
jgi:hypothetical protein